MAVQVNIPTPLRRITKGQNQLEANASNIGELLDVLDQDYPGFRDRLVDESGEIRYFVNIYLNGEDVRFLQGTETSTTSGDEISIVPAVAGGTW